MSGVDWAWAAGLFEGEGHISNRKYKQNHPASGARQRVLVLGMCDEDVVRKFHSVVGVGRVSVLNPPKDRPNARPVWRWECSRWTEIEQVLKTLLPHFGERRTASAEHCLAHPPLPHHNLRKTHCLRGHPLSGDNVRVTPGRRRCRACERLRREARKEANEYSGV